MKVLLWLGLAAISTIGIPQDDKSEAEAAEAYKAWSEANRLLALREDVQGLYGVKGICVAINELGDDAKAAGLTVEGLMDVAELKLRLAGIHVNRYDGWTASEDKAALAIGIGGGKATQGSFFCFSIRLDFKQKVYLQRMPSLSNQATTWSKGMTGWCSENVFRERVRQQVKDLVDTFINDYLMANPIGRRSDGGASINRLEAGEMMDLTHGFMSGFCQCFFQEAGLSCNRYRG